MPISRLLIIITEPLTLHRVLEHTLIENLVAGLPASQSVVNYTGAKYYFRFYVLVSRFMMGGDENKSLCGYSWFISEEGTLKNLAVIKNPYALSLGCLTILGFFEQM